MVADALSRLTMCSVSRVKEVKKDLVKVFHKFDTLGVNLDDSQHGGLVVNYNSEYSLVVEVKSVKSNKHIDSLLL